MSGAPKGRHAKAWGNAPRGEINPISKPLWGEINMLRIFVHVYHTLFRLFRAERTIVVLVYPISIAPCIEATSIGTLIDFEFEVEKVEATKSARKQNKRILGFIFYSFWALKDMSNVSFSGAAALRHPSTTPQSSEAGTI